MIQLILQLFFCFAVSTGEIPDDYKLTILGPINWTGGAKTNLVVTSPENFKSITPSSLWGQSSIIEFIPVSEAPESWSEIVTFHRIVGKSANAENISSLLEKDFKNAAKNLRIFEKKTQNENRYLSSSLFLSYDYNGKHEVFGSYYYSGPFDAVGIQMTIRAKKGEKDEMLIEKIRKTLQSISHVTDSND